jgi:hypothetical protein
MKAIPQTSYGETNQATNGDNTTTCCGEQLRGGPETPVDRGVRLFDHLVGKLGETVGSALVRDGKFGDKPFATTITVTWNISACWHIPSLAETFRKLHAAGKYAPQF